jgi:hypothetical protein
VGSIFPVLDEQMASYVAGTWRGYADALNRQAKGPGDTMSAMGGNWQGRRADLFNQWWGPASADLATLANVAQMMADGFDQFASRVPEINALIAQMESLVTSNTQPGAFSGRYLLTIDGAQYKNDVFYITITGFAIEGPLGPGVDRPTPAWFTQLMGLLREVQLRYNAAANAAAATISAAPGMLKGMTQLKEISRGSAAIGSAGPFASLNDPTWKLLTGGGVFRPTLAPGFRGDPFSGKDLPSWYHPTVGQQIANWVGGHIGDLVDVGSLLLALAGQPELGAGLEFVYGAGEDVKAVVGGDWGEAALDTLNLVVALPGLGVGGRTAEHVADDFSLGHGFSQAVQGALNESDRSIPPVVAEHFGDYVQGRVEDYVKQQITDAVKAGGDPPPHVTVPASVLSRIMNQAAARMGEERSLQAAGLPTTP